MIRLVAPPVTVVVLLSAVLAVPAFAQGVREGKMRIVGRATVEAVPDYVTVQVGISNRAASPTRPELGGRPQDHRFLERLRRGRAGHPDLLRQSGAELQDRARPQRDNAAGTGRLQREQHGQGQARRPLASGKFHAPNPRSGRDQYRRRNGQLRIPPQHARTGLARQRGRARIQRMHRHKNIPPRASSSARTLAA